MLCECTFCDTFIYFLFSVGEVNRVKLSPTLVLNDSKAIRNGKLAFVSSSMLNICKASTSSR